MQNNILPHSEELEQMIVGHMIYDPELLEGIINKINAEQFYYSKHQTIFTNIVELFSNNQAVDIVLLRLHMEKNKTLSDVGGIAYLTFIGLGLLSGAKINDYISEFIKLYVLRETIKSLQIALQKTFKNDGEIDGIITELKQSVVSLNVCTIKAPYSAIIEVKDNVYKEIEQYEQGKTIGISTGYIDLDEKIGGIHKNDLTILAGATSIGKTTFALNLALNVLHQGMRVGYLSMETSASIIYQRLACMEIKKDYSLLRRGYFSSVDYSNLKGMVEALSDLPLFVIDNGGINRMGVLSGSRRMRQEQCVDLIIIDYLQQISHNDREMRVQQVSGDVRAIKGLNVDLSIPIILISSLSRAYDVSADKKPRLSHLKESGDIEYSIDTALMLHRDKDDHTNNIVTVLIEKQRYCGVSQVELLYQPQSGRYVNCERRQTWHDKS